MTQINPDFLANSVAQSTQQIDPNFLQKSIAETQQPPQDAKAQEEARYRTLAGPFRQGLRSGANSAGAMINSFVGGAAESMGLTEFADSRYKAAAEYIADGEAVAPPVRDISQIKDLSSLASFVAGHAGSGIATSLPALGAAIGLRRPIAGVFGAAGAMEAGEQLNTLRNDPKVMATTTHAERMANAAGKGIIGGALELGGGAGQAARILSRGATKGVGKTLLQGTVGEAVTEGAQDLTGQAFHQQLNPDVQIDPMQIANAAAAGASGGGVMTGGAQAVAAIPQLAAKSATELRARLNKNKPPDPYEVDAEMLDPNTPPERVDQIITEKDDTFSKYWDSIKSHPDLQKFKDYDLSEPDVRERLSGELQEMYRTSTVKPVVELGMSKLKEAVSDPVEWAKGVATGLGLDKIADAVSKNARVVLDKANAKTEEFLVNSGYRKATDGAWEPIVKRTKVKDKIDLSIEEDVKASIPPDTMKMIDSAKISEMARMLRQMAGNPTALRRSAASPEIRKAFGPQYRALLERTIEKTYTDETAMLNAHRAMKQAFDLAEGMDVNREETIKAIILANLKPEYAQDRSMRATAEQELVPKLMSYLENQGEGNEDFVPAMAEAFENPGQVLEDLSTAITEQETTSDEAFRTNEPDEEPGSNPYEDKRLGKRMPISEDNKRIKDDLEAEYGPKNVRVVPVNHGDGTMSLELEPTDQVGLSDTEWKAVMAAEGDSGFKDGVLKVMTTKQGPAGPVANNISLIKLTHLMMRTATPSDGQVEARYVADMLSQGVAKLVASPQFSSVPGGFKIPDNTPIAYTDKFDENGHKVVKYVRPDGKTVYEKKEWTFGDVRKSWYYPGKVAREMRAGINQAAKKHGKDSDEFKGAVKALSKYHDDRMATQHGIDQWEESVMAVLDDQGPANAEEMIPPIKKGMPGPEKAAIARLERAIEKARNPDPTTDDGMGRDLHDFQAKQVVRRGAYEEDTGLPLNKAPAAGSRQPGEGGPVTKVAKAKLSKDMKLPGSLQTPAFRTPEAKNLQKPNLEPTLNRGISNPDDLTRLARLDKELDATITERESRTVKGLPDAKEPPNKTQVAQQKGKEIFETALDKLLNDVNVTPAEFAKMASEGKIKLSQMSQKVAAERGLTGIHAAHDSPHQFDGKFDWRNNLLKGEGHAAKGAGTYLSTGDGEHKHYKRYFTAIVRGAGDTVERLNAAKKHVEQTMTQIEKIMDPAAWYPWKNDKGVQFMSPEGGHGHSFERQETGYNPDGTEHSGKWIHEDVTDDFGIPELFNTFEEAHAEYKHVLKNYLEKHKDTLADIDGRIARLKGRPLSKKVSLTYHVTVNAKPEEIMDWNAPLSEQKALLDKIEEAILRHGSEMDFDAEVVIGDSGLGAWGQPDPEYGRAGSVLEDVVNNPKSVTGEKLYRALAAALGEKTLPGMGFKNKRAASEFLQSLGIVGHKYAASAGKNKDRPNYVIYDDSRIETNFVEFSKVKLGTEPMTDEAKQQIRDYVTKVLGKAKTKVLFEAFEHAGGFAKLKGEEVLMISVNAIDPMSIAHHEALHAMFARITKADKNAANVLLRAAQAPQVQARLKELLKNEPAALEQLKDPEEALAYMYQFWAAGEQGLLTIGPKTRKWFDKIKGFFRILTGLWADNLNSAADMERAGEILDAFHSGKMAQRNSVANVLAGMGPDFTKSMHGSWPMLAKFADRFMYTAAGAVRGMNYKPLSDIVDKFHTMASTSEKGPGWLESKHAEFFKRLNKVAKVLEGKTEEQQLEILRELRSKAPRTSAEAKAIGAVLDEALVYMKRAGVKAVAEIKDGKPVYRDIREVANYMARAYDHDAVREKKGAFIAVLKKYKISEPEKVWEHLAVGMSEQSPASDHGFGMTLYTPQINERVLGNIPDNELEPFLVNDLFGLMSQYLGRAARRAEYTRRFGNSGEDIVAAVKAAREIGATDEQIETFNQSVRAMEGTLGANMSQKLRNVYGAVTTYQNVRLLPLALFSSLVDPLGIAVRGGSMREAGAAFIRGITDLFGANKDRAYDLAQTIGAINAATDVEVIGDMYGSQFMPSWQKHINDKFFKYNGMESWNRSMRVASAAAGEQFLIKHATKPTKDSERYLKELGLTKKDVWVTDGKIDLNEATTKALNMWVDQSIIRPNAANRPAYMSDPNWILISHLKQYMYMFQKVIIARAYHEMSYGNVNPMLTLVGYVPLIIASDILRMHLTPGDADNNYRAGWTTLDWLASGVQRAGLTGPGEIMLDSRMGMNPINLLGPQAQQINQFVSASLDGGLSAEFVRAVPGLRYFK